VPINQRLATCPRPATIRPSIRRSARRVRGWRLRLRLGSLFAPRFLWECLNYPHPISVSIACFHHIPPPLRRRVLRGCLPEPALSLSKGSSRLPWPSPSLTGSAPPCSPPGANISTLQACPELVGGIHLMLRAAALRSFLRRIQRFSTSGRPEALAAWPLPRPDFHRLADDSFQDTPANCYAAEFFSNEDWLSTNLALISRSKSKRTRHLTRRSILGDCVNKMVVI
jgi:hypothetical protein